MHIPERIAKLVEPVPPKNRKKRDGERQAYRILNIVSYLLSCPQGASREELAAHFGVHRTTISRDLAKIPEKSGMYESEGGRLHVNREQYLVNASFTLHEVMALYLATRLLATRMDRRNPHAAAALRKLSTGVEKLSPAVARQMSRSASALDSSEQWEDQAYITALERLTQALADGHKVRLWHRNDKAATLNEHIFAPYLIEPYAIGQSSHVIGWNDTKGRLYTFKIERIEQVEILKETYLLPPEFNIHDLLEDAWGIWFTEEAPVEVVLRFSARVTWRVKESRWHRSQQIESLPDGGLLWRARIAAPTEMLPWIKSWGADVEVVAPPEVRAALAEDARRLFAQYHSEG